MSGSRRLRVLCRADQGRGRRRENRGLEEAKDIDVALRGFVPPGAAEQLVELLRPFGARPHWGKLFTPDGHDWESLYPRFADFRLLAAAHDPEGKFRNRLLDSVLGAPAVNAGRETMSLAVTGGSRHQRRFFRRFGHCTFSRINPSRSESTVMIAAMR